MSFGATRVRFCVKICPWIRRLSLVQSRDLSTRDHPLLESIVPDSSRGKNPTTGVKRRTPTPAIISQHAEKSSEPRSVARICTKANRLVTYNS